MTTSFEYADIPAIRWIERLREALQGPLPGLQAHLEMAPDGRETVPPPVDTLRQSAVLALLHRHNKALAIPFTLRPDSLAHHGGEISLPGGGAEPIDDTLEETAIRETEEELGISARDVVILGHLSPLYIAPSRNLVHPYIGWLPSLPALDPDPREVDAVLDITVTSLLDQENLDTYVWRNNGKLREAPCYRVGGACIWGATAMILSELLQVIRRLPDLDLP